MGAEYFETYVEGTDGQKAFDDAREEAMYEYGHSGYTGTIAEKTEFEVRMSKPLEIQLARFFAEKDGDNNEKWGPAFCVPVGNKEGETTGFIFYGWASS